MRKTSGKVENSIHERQLASLERPFQQAIISTVLHGFFHLEPFEEKFSVDCLLPLLNQVGLEALSPGASRVVRKMDQKDVQKLHWILEEALPSKKLFKDLQAGSASVRRILELWLSPQSSEGRTLQDRRQGY